MHGKKDNGLYEYYIAHLTDRDPKANVYVAGLGFTPPPMPSQERKLVRAYSTVIGAALVLFMLGSALLSQLFGSLVVPLSGQISYTAFQLLEELSGVLSYAVALAVPMLLYCKRIRIPPGKAFPMGRPNTGLALAATPILLMATVVGSYCGTLLGMVTGLFGFLPVSPNYLPPTRFLPFVVFFVGNTVLPALLEELLFRGAVLQSLRRFGDGFALLVSSLLFGLVHGNLVQMPVAFLAGLVLGYFALRTGSLGAGMLAHFVNNALSLLLGMLIERCSVGSQLIVLNLVYILYLAAGLAATAYVVRHYPNMFRLHSARSRTGEGEKLRAFFTAPGALLFLGTVSFYTAQYCLVFW